VESNSNKKVGKINSISSISAIKLVDAITIARTQKKMLHTNSKLEPFAYVEA